jgi:hypothetical protein
MGKQIASKILLSAADQALLGKINAAVTTANEAEKAAETAKTDYAHQMDALTFVQDTLKRLRAEAKSRRSAA